MPYFMTDHEDCENTEDKDNNQSQDRITRLKNAVFGSQPGVCTQRAVIWTAYHKKAKNRKKPNHIQMAESLRDVLLKKSIAIYPDETVVGNYTSKRVGGSIYPELHGVPVLMDMFKFSSRKTNPLQISKKEIWQLLKIIPFWMFRFMALKAYKSPLKVIRLVLHQLKGYFYIINESGGISHLAPDYKKLITIGTEGIAKEAETLQKKAMQGSDAWHFYEGVKIIVQALARFGERYAGLADKMADRETDEKRKKELNEIAEVCRNVPRKGAASFREAIQSIFFAQIAINLESLDNAVCPGRMDQYLYPFYKRDMEKKAINRKTAKELMAAFSIKMSEIIPVFSEYLTGIHGGMFNGQVVTVGGVDENGNDATNELSYIFLEVMDELRMRQPNYHARVSSGSPEKYMDKINEVLLAGSNSPALYNDEIIVETMCKHGYTIQDARDYTGVGCVEPVSQGKSFASTDAALVNVPIILEMALNCGKRFNSTMKHGADTKAVDRMRSMDEVKEAFEIQLGFQIQQMVTDLQAIERANRKYHPTPLTSSLLSGCLESGKCSTEGGAKYNFSGIQCVAPTDTGDALYAIDKVVFRDKRLPLQELVFGLKQNLKDTPLRTLLRGLEKFGNDDPDVDQWTVYVIDEFIKQLSKHENTRGGRYVAGLYSVTTHEFYGKITGALPNGRQKGESFASGISPSNGSDRLGPTALINSVNRIDFTKVANGINFNMKFDPHTLQGKTGGNILGSLLNTHFKKGGMQAQVNVLDPETLKKAREHPEQYPNLLVRVSGYSAYFNDLTPKMKDEIIRRSCIQV